MSTARTPLVAGNWKLNKTVGEAVDTVNTLKPLVAGVTNVDIVVCPVYTALYPACQAASGSNVEVGAQRGNQVAPIAAATVGDQPVGR